MGLGPGNVYGPGTCAWGSLDLGISIGLGPGNVYGPGTWECLWAWDVGMFMGLGPEHGNPMDRFRIQMQKNSEFRIQTWESSCLSLFLMTWPTRRTGGRREAETYVATLHRWPLF